jgi:hypothetical protein
LYSSAPPAVKRFQHGEDAGSTFMLVSTRDRC